MINTIYAFWYQYFKRDIYLSHIRNGIIDSILKVI